MRTHRDGQLQGAPYFQIIIGVRNALHADRAAFDLLVATIRRLLPGAPWCAAGIGAVQVVLNDWDVAAGGHARTGLADNVRLDRHALVPPDAALVRRVVGLYKCRARCVPTSREARAIPGLRIPAEVG